MPTRPPSHNSGPPRKRQDVRPNAGLRGYGGEWRKARASFLADNPLCVKCQADGLTTVATVVDHIEPHRGDMVKFWDGRWQALCVTCHSRKTATEDGGFGHAGRAG